jgi:hypothetical protein
MVVADMAITEEGRASIMEGRIMAGRTSITEADRTSTGMDDASGNESARPEGVLAH